MATAVLNSQKGISQVNDSDRQSRRSVDYAKQNAGISYKDMLSSFTGEGKSSNKFEQNGQNGQNGVNAQNKTISADKSLNSANSNTLSLTDLGLGRGLSNFSRIKMMSSEQVQKEPERTATEIPQTIPAKATSTVTYKNNLNANTPTIVSISQNETVTTTTHHMLGDINGDGKISLTDLSKMDLHLAGDRALTEDEMFRADANQDGIVDKQDDELLSLKFLGYDTGTNIGKTVQKKDTTTVINTVNEATATPDNPLTLTMSDDSVVTVTNGSYKQGSSLPIITTIPYYDSLGNARSAMLYFTKSNTNEWTASLSPDMKQNTTTLVETDGTTTSFTMEPQKIYFGTNGVYDQSEKNGVGPLVMQNPVGGLQTIALDFSGLTQLTGENSIYSVSDGTATGMLKKTYVNKEGQTVGVYSNGVSVNIGISVNANGKIQEALQKEVDPKEDSIEDIVYDKIEHVQKKINEIKGNEKTDATYVKRNKFETHIGNVKTDQGNYYFSQNTRIDTKYSSGDNMEVKNVAVGDNIQILAEMHSSYANVSIPQIDGKIISSEPIRIRTSAYISMKVGNEKTITEVFPVGDTGLDIITSGIERDITIYGSDYDDNIEYGFRTDRVTYYAGSGKNTINYNCGYSGNNIYANQGTNTINLYMDVSGPKIKGGGVNTYNVYYNNFLSNVKIEDFSEDDVIVLKRKINRYDIRALRGNNGEINIVEGRNNDIIASLSGNIDFNGKIKGLDYHGNEFAVTLSDLIAPVGRRESLRRIWSDGIYHDKSNNTTIEVTNAKTDDGKSSYVELYGYKINGEATVSEVSMMNDNGNLKITEAKKLRFTNRGCDSVILDGSATINMTDGELLVKTEDNVAITIIDNNATVMTKEGDNKIRLEGKSNILYMENGNNKLEITNEKAKVTTSGGTNKIDIRGKEAQIVLSGGSNDIKVFDKSAHIHCGNGEDSITIKSTGTTISNFDFDKDKLNFGSYSELEADIQGRSIVVRGKDSNSEDFVVSLLGTTDIDKIQKLIEEHNENVQKDEMSRKLTESYASLENSLAEKIGTAIKNDVEPVFEAKDALKQIDKIGKIEGNTHLPQNVIDRYKEYIAESMANSAITADDLTNTERIVNSWASIFGDDKEIPIGEYTIVPTAISYNGIGAFKADVKKDGKYVTTLYMSNLDNKALSEAVTDFIAAGQKVYKSKLNEAIKSYVDEVGDAFGVNLGESYDIGVGVINLLSGGDAGKSKFSKMLNSFGQKNVEKLIERTFGREGKNMIKAVKSLKDAKDNIDNAINTANLTDYEKITGLLNATAKLIGKL